MIKLKDILLESTAPDIFVPRRLEDRLERMISLYIRNGSKGDISLSGLNLTVLPDILKNISVGGNFWCGHNELTSLQGAPKSVIGFFLCSYNNLTSLEGGPVEVGIDFLCSYNNLTSLKGAPETVGVDFDCSYNNLTSLKGAPETVGGDFVCYNNPVKFTEEQVRTVCNVKGRIFV
jgi:hypothetical protein